MAKINATISHDSISMNPLRLVSTDVPQTLAQGIAAALATGDNTMPAVTTKGSPSINTSTAANLSVLGEQAATGASVIVSAATILISPWKVVPTFVDLISTTLTAVAVVDAGSIVSNVTGRTQNQVTLTPASMTGIQVGMRLIHSVTTNYAGTFYVESITTTTYNIAAPFVAETTSTSNLVKAVNTGLTIAAGEVYELTSPQDVQNFKYVSAATGVPGTLNIDLKWGG